MDPQTQQTGQRGPSLPASSIDPQALEDCKSPAVTHHDIAGTGGGGIVTKSPPGHAISIVCKRLLIDLSVNRTMF